LGAPEKKCEGKQKFKNWRKIQHIMANNFGASGNNFTKPVHGVPRGRDETLGTILGGPAPSEFSGALLGAISDKFRR